MMDNVENNPTKRGLKFLDVYQNEKPLKIVEGLKSEGVLSDGLASGMSNIISKMEKNGFNIDVKFKSHARFLDDAFGESGLGKSSGVNVRVKDHNGKSNLLGDTKKTNYVRISDKPENAMATIAHEFMHSITNSSIDYARKFPKSKEGIALSRLEKVQSLVFKKAKEAIEAERIRTGVGSSGSKLIDDEINFMNKNGNFRDIGMFGNIKEFITYSTTHPEVIDFLKKTKLPKGNKSPNLMQLIIDRLGFMFGAPKKHQQEFTNLYNKISDYSIKLGDMTDYSKLDDVTKYSKD